MTAAAARINGAWRSDIKARRALIILWRGENISDATFSLARKRAALTPTLLSTRQRILTALSTTLARIWRAAQHAARKRAGLSASSA